MSDPRICLACGIDLDPETPGYGRRFCSRACGAVGDRRRCRTCGRYIVHRIASARYCSHRCSSRYRAAEARADR